MKLDQTEIAVLREKGKALVTGREHQLTRMSDDELRRFVLDYCSGQLLTNLDVPESMVGIVFLPISMGALNLPEGILAELDQIIPRPGAHPVLIAKPQPPTETELPAKPVQPEVLTGDPDLLADLEMEINWHINQQEFISRRDAYLENLAKENALLEQQYQESLKVWAQLCQEIQAKNAALHDAFGQETQRVDELNSPFESNFQDWELHTARRQEVERGAHIQYFSLIGVISGRYADAFPTGINGLPMFHTIQFVHPEDWKRASAAIKRELERAKTLDV